MRASLRALSIVMLGALSGACAGRLHSGSRADRAPVPTWIATLVGCNRAQLDREWQHARYQPLAGNDTACVALGRLGEPHYVSETHDPSSGSLVSMSWSDVPGTAGVNIMAVRNDSGGGTGWPTSYFQVTLDQVATRKAPDTSHTASIVGSVIDSLGHGPGRAVHVCALHLRDGSQADTTRRCVTSEPGGGFLIDRLPAHGVFVQISCDAPSFFQQSLLNTTLVPGRPTSVAQLPVVSFKGCDTRPVRTIHGTFSGHWSGGFEENRFAACPRDSWRTPADSLAPRRRGDAVAWVYSLPRSLTQQWWNEHNARGSYARDSYGSVVRYVRWRGTITGPGNFGHLGVSEWRIDVDSVITMRAPRPHDCE